MPIQNYSQDIFFYPWVGEKYEDGMRFRGHNIEFGDRNDPKNKEHGFYKVMVLGKEHYCENRKKCERYIEENNKLHPNEYCNMHVIDNNGQKSQACGHLSYCREYTKNVINDAINNIYKSHSHINFLKAVDTQQTHSFWNHLLFTNFYQQSKPQKEGNSHNKNEDVQALKAFADIVKNHRPDIIITWGDDPFNIIQEQQEISINRFKISLQNSKNLSPRLQINQDNYTVLFTVLTWTDEETRQEVSCLLVSTGYHPSSSLFHCDEFNKYLLGIWNFYNKLIKWKPIFPKRHLGITIEYLNKIQDKIGKKQNTPKESKKKFDLCREIMKQYLQDNFSTHPVAQKILDLLEKVDSDKAKSVKIFIKELKKQISQIINFDIQITWSERN